jgi:hypothetical protein
MMHFILVGFQGDVESKKGMDSTCLQNIVDEGEVDTNGNAQMGIAAHLVSANDTSVDVFYDSQGEREGCEHGTHEMNKKSNEVLLLGKERVRTAGNVELSKQNVQHAVELYPQQESFQAREALDFTSETEQKLLDVAMSEMDFEEHDMYKLSALTEDSPNGARLHPEEPEVSELKNDGKCVTEEEKEMDLISKTEELRPKSSNKRTKSASSKGSPSQFVSRSVASTRPSCVNLMKVKDTVERAIRVSTTKILYKRSSTYVRNFHLPSNFDICYGAFGHR